MKIHIPFLYTLAVWALALITTIVFAFPAGLIVSLFSTGPLIFLWVILTHGPMSPFGDFLLLGSAMVIWGWLAGRFVYRSLLRDRVAQSAWWIAASMVVMLILFTGFWLRYRGWFENSNWK